MTREQIRPTLLYADSQGSIYDHPHLQMLTRRGEELALPRPDELMPLPPESDLFLLPGRRALGLDPDTGQVEPSDKGHTAVAAFVCPGHTLTGLAAYLREPGAPVLPLFAYGAVGYAGGRFWVAAKRVDEDPRQVFHHIDPARIRRGAEDWLQRFPGNRLVAHLAGCALTNCCPAARNLCLGRYEAPLPTSRACNARCLGCISLQPDDSGFPATQRRIQFTPDADEVAQIMRRHAEQERRPVFSFGQGCEGEPLTEAPLIAEAIRRYRQGGGKGTINVNTNASLPGVVEELARAGLDSIRVSMNSARQALYEAYHRPASYGFSDVLESIRIAKKAGLFVSLNYFFFPGVSDTETEWEALTGLVQDLGVDFIQLRNLNLDPDLYLSLTAGMNLGPSMGFLNFRKRLRKACPGLGFGYFNPYLAGRATASP